ncbi:MAG: hypothetical protein OET63_04780 [Desulfobacterales bacterium]|jgi:hypothetical protein|nr:hypothetical protein [Desulfobacterales bacterium]
MINYKKLKTVINNLEAEINNYNNNFLKIFPLRKYINLIDKYPEHAGLQYCSREVERYCEDIIESSDLQILELYHKLLMVTLISIFKKRVKNKKLPDEVQQYYFKDFDRIICQIENDTDFSGYYLYPNYHFCMDISTCSLRVFPIGGRKYHLSRFPVRKFLNKGGRQFVSVLLFLIFETGGREPFLRVHYDTHDPGFMDGWTLEGLIYSSRILADVMKMNPQIKGKIGTSWLGDPQIERISPRLAYIRYFVIANGANFFYLGSSDKAAKDATKKSSTRRRLYSEGKYVPSDYLEAWSRKRMIKWANKLKWYW